MKINKKQKRLRLHKKVRSKISGTATVPRVAVYRSNAHIYVQVIDDTSNQTILGLSDKGLEGTKSERAKLLGQIAAENILKKNIKRVLFDRGGFKYHGRVQKVAEGLRAGGLIV